MLTLSSLFLSESGQPICGNGMVEQGEECDCGYSDQCKDECCYDANQPEGKKCKLKPGKQCRYLANSSNVYFPVKSPEGSYDRFKTEIKRAYGFETLFLFIVLFYLFFWGSLA